MFIGYVWEKVDLCFIIQPISKTINNIQKVLTCLLELFLISSNLKKRLFPLVNKLIVRFNLSLSINQKPLIDRRKTKLFKQHKNFYYTLIKLIRPFNIELLSFDNKASSYTIELGHIRKFLIKK